MKQIILVVVVCLLLAGCSRPTKNATYPLLPKYSATWDGTYRFIPKLTAPKDGEMYIIIYPDGRIESIK